MNYKREIIKLIENINEEKEKSFLVQILVMIKTHMVGRR